LKRGEERYETEVNWTASQKVLHGQENRGLGRKPVLPENRKGGTHDVQFTDEEGEKLRALRKINAKKSVRQLNQLGNVKRIVSGECASRK